MPVMLSEIKTQIAVGALKNPQEIATLVALTDDKDAIQWAINHKYFQVRAVAIKHKNCSIVNVLKALLYDKSNIVRQTSRRVLISRKQEMALFFECLQEYPQFCFSFMKYLPEEIATEDDDIADMLLAEEEDC